MRKMQTRKLSAAFAYVEGEFQEFWLSADDPSAGGRLQGQLSLQTGHAAVVGSDAVPDTSQDHRHH